jgi:sugar phosphate permease
MMVSLVLAGESIYMLPYGLRREFQTSMLETMNLTNTELGSLNSIFGVLALATYFLGGWLADRLSIRKLITASLIATALGGFYMASFPGYFELIALFSFWGVFSILTFWAALIKATRAWGGRDEQGRAFGILDGGRGLVSAALASIGIALFAQFQTATHGLRSVILLYSSAILFAAVLTWLFIDDDVTKRGSSQVKRADRGRGIVARFLAVARLPVVWLNAIVILAAYMGYWGTFDISAFAVDAWGRDQVFGATVSTFGVWLRPISAIGAGLIADRIDSSRAVMACFASLIVTFTVFAFVPTREAFLWLLWANTAAISAAVFALRGIYYALLEEGDVPMALTGTTVGVVSVIGYTPDIFTPLLSGWLLDTYPGGAGHQYFFGILAGAAAVGLLAAFAIRRFTNQPAPGRA